MSITTEPCSWPVSYAACTSLPDGWLGDALADPVVPPHADRATFEQMAADFLWRWTGRSLGVCDVSIRPCRNNLSLGGGPTTFEGRGPTLGGGTPWTPVLLRGEWWNIGCGGCGFDACGCDGPESILLPGPVASVSEVIIDGVTLAPSEYRVDGNRLIRLVGAWPTGQFLSLPDGAEGTWSVTYQRGIEVPVGGQIAAGVLAVELFRAACGDSGCGLPKRFQSITRQGVTVAMLDSFEDIDKGHTGIFLIDSWIASMSVPLRRSSVYSPDVRATRQRRAVGS